MNETDPDMINPSEFKNGAESITVKIGSRIITMQPDHPVENVSWEMVVKFIGDLNYLSKSDDENIQSQLRAIMPGHQKGDVYDLPTEAQWEFVMRNRGKANKAFFDRDYEVDILNYAWVSENSGDQTHAVATRLPRIIDRGDGVLVRFYDLEGNVYEWNKDWHDEKLMGGKDPQGPVAPSKYRVIRGGSWESAAQSLHSDDRFGISPGGRRSSAGFRLVRTRP
jgi:formylglycine-generating enzyme required for sulfatase activity